jgi:putative endonuclease
MHTKLCHMVTSEGIIAVYMMASGKHGTLYIGVTSNLARRAWEHQQGLIPGFTAKHGCKRLVWKQSFELMTNAIRREKTMKQWPRQWKINLIERENPNWDDIYGYWV